MLLPTAAVWLCEASAPTLGSKDEKRSAWKNSIYLKTIYISFSGKKKGKILDRNVCGRGWGVALAGGEEEA